jgi:hypothetical protein
MVQEEKQNHDFAVKATKQVIIFLISIETAQRWLRYASNYVWNVARKELSHHFPTVV